MSLSILQKTFIGVIPSHTGRDVSANPCKVFIQFQSYRYRLVYRQRFLYQSWQDIYLSQPQSYRQKCLYKSWKSVISVIPSHTGRGVSINPLRVFLCMFRQMSSFCSKDSKSKKLKTKSITYWLINRKLRDFLQFLFFLFSASSQLVRGLPVSRRNCIFQVVSNKVIMLSEAS